MPYTILKKALYILAIVTFIVICQPSHAKTAEEIQSELEALNLQLEYLKIQDSELTIKTKKLESDIKKKTNEIANLKQQIQTAAKASKQLQTDTANLVKDLDSIKRRLENSSDLIKKRILQLHKNQNKAMFNSILSAKSATAFQHRYTMVSYLMEHDKRLFAELSSNLKEKESKSLHLQNKLKVLEVTNAELADREKVLAQEESTLKSMMETLLLQKKANLEKGKRLDNSRQELEKIITEATKSANTARLDQELQASRQKRESKQSSQAQSQNQPQRQIKTLQQGAQALDFNWPFNTSDISRAELTGFGDTASMKIYTHKPQEVLAIGEGKVLYKGIVSGFNKMVILGHEKGFSSVYADLKEIWVGINEVVQKGESIGEIAGGQSGRLHFEIRFAGKKQTPSELLPKSSVDILQK
ncbi:MAG: peptidoglycan DD-metalloendopeptidase family protein [Candidatus Riflebacteria bacterium]|nr:peptidoglycan DD-metalloendopeptidase family protein [Candidatus Riflebacteria bacterium]